MVVDERGIESGGQRPGLKRGPRRLAWAGGFVVLAVVLGLAWTGVWYLAAQKSAATLDAWVAREKIFHRNWTCPNRQIAGYPFAVEVSCSKPRFEGLIFGRHYAGALAGFVASADLRHPTDVAIKMASPFAVASDDRAMDLSLTWDDLAVRLGGDPAEVTEVAMSGRGLSLQGHTQGIGAVAARTAQADAVLRRDVTRPDRTLHFDVALSGAAFPAVDALLGSPTPAQITVSGVVTEASFDPAKTLAETLDQWRLANGHVEIAKLVATRGSAHIEASGPLGLSATHQLQGKLNTKCVGFEPVLQRLGVDPGLIAAGSLLASLLGGGDKGEAKSGPQPLELPIGFNSGRLIVGPVRTSIQLPPLY